nr:retrovirus-related Pol polyprotein from transposon TNT 1-94 [Tanacetum cinerariifolium]
YLQTQLLISQKEEAGIQLQAEEFDFMAAAGDLDEIKDVNAKYILMENLQHASTSGTQLDKALVYDIDGSAENDNHVTSVALSIVQSGGRVETSYASDEETYAHQESIYRNLVDQVAQVNMVNCNMRVTNAELKYKLARYKIQEQHIEISQEKYDKLERCYQKFVYQEQCLTRKINALYLSSAKLKHDFKTREDKFLDKEVDLEARIKDLKNILLKRDQTVQTIHILNPKPDSFYHPNQKMDLGYPNPTYLKKAQLKQQSLYNGNLLLEEHNPHVVYDSEETLELAQETKFVRDFKSLAKKADESLDKQKYLELEIKRLLKASVSHDIMSNVQNVFVDAPSNLRTELDPYNDMQQNVERLQAQLRDLKGKSSDTPSASNTLDPLNHKLESKIVELEFLVVNYKREISHLKTTYKNLFDSISSNRAHAKLHDLIYEIAQLRAWVFENTFESMKNTSRTTVTPHVDKPKLSAVTPLSKKLHASMPSHSIPQPREFNVLKHRNENVSSKMVTTSSTRLDHTARTRRPQPKGNIRNVRVPTSPKSSEVKKNVTVEEHRRTLLLSKNQKTISSECNNIKLAIRNDKSEIICANCKQCLVTTNHDACLPSSVNALNSHANKLCTNVPLSANQNRHRTQVWKPKQVGSKENLLVSLDCLDLALNGHPLDEPMRKRFPNSNVFLGRLSKFVCGIFDSVGITHETSAAKTPQQNGVVECRNHMLVEAARTMLIFSHALLFLWAEAIATACYTQYRSIIHRRFNKTPYELIQGRKPDISYLYVFRALCYLKNDHEDIGKLGAKGDIGFFIGYSANSVAYKVYNRRTKKIMETMNVTFDELSAMAFEQNSSRLSLQSMTSGQISSKLELTYAPSTITHQITSERNLDILFEPLHNEYLSGRPSEAPRAILAALVNDHEDIGKLGAKGDIGFFSGYSANSVAYKVYNRRTKKIMETMNVTFDELSTMAFEQNSSRPSLQSMTSGQISSKLKLTYAPSTITHQRPSERNLDILFEPLHNEYLGGRPSEAPRAILAALVHYGTKDCQEALTDPAWIESMQEELHQFIRLDVWELVPSPDGIKPLTLKCYSDGSYQDILGIRCTQRIHSVSNGRENCIPAWFIKRTRGMVDELSTFLLQNGLSKAIIDLTLFTRRFNDDILVVNQSPSGIFINQSKYVHEILKKYGLNTCDIVGTPMDIKHKLDLDQIGTQTIDDGNPSGAIIKQDLGRREIMISSFIAQMISSQKIKILDHKHAEGTAKNSQDNKVLRLKVKTYAMTTP